MDVRGFPTRLPEFQKVFPDDSACAQYLEALRWPDGFVCPKCGSQVSPWRMENRPVVVLRCSKCRRDVSLTAGTTMQDTRMPLSTWFWGAYLMTTQTPGISSVQFQRQLGITRNETAFNILHKLRSAMVRPDRDPIGGEWPIEIDECFMGGKTRGEGRGVHHKSLVIGAVEVRTKKPPPEDPIARQEWIRSTPAGKKIYAGRLRLQLLPDRKMDMLTGFVKENIASGATIMSDGWQGYNEVPELGYKRKPLVMAGDPDKAEKHLPLIHLVFSNLKTWILGTHHGRVEPRHLQAYLNEYVFRFNRRFYPMTTFNSILGIASRTIPPTYEQLYSGKWQHPGACSELEFL